MLYGSAVDTNVLVNSVDRDNRLNLTVDCDNRLETRCLVPSMPIKSYYIVLETQYTAHTYILLQHYYGLVHLHLLGIHCRCGKFYRETICSKISN